MKRINGRDCSLFIEQKGNSVLVPYKQETIRECLEGYSLNPCIGNLEKETYISLDSSVNGCFVARLARKFAIVLFQALSAPSSPYSFLIGRVIEKKKSTRTFLQRHLTSLETTRNPFTQNLKSSRTRTQKSKNTRNYQLKSFQKEPTPSTAKQFMRTE